MKLCSVREILVDALGAQAQIAFGLDHSSPGLALAFATRVGCQASLAEPKWWGECCGSVPVSRLSEPGGALAGFDVDSGESEPEGALAGFGAALACLR